MFALDCPRCDVAWLVDTSSIVTLTNTAGGPVVRARCPEGHLVTRAFGATPHAHAVAAN